MSSSDEAVVEEAAAVPEEVSEESSDLDSEEEEVSESSGDVDEEEETEEDGDESVEEAAVSEEDSEESSDADNEEEMSESSGDVDEEEEEMDATEDGDEAVEQAAVPEQFSEESVENGNDQASGEDVVFAGESYDLPEEVEEEELESFDAIGLQDSYDSITQKMYSGDEYFYEDENMNADEVLEEGEEIMEETLEDVLDEVDAIIEETRAGSMDGEVDEAMDFDSTDTVVEEPLEVNWFEEDLDSPVLVREDEENNVLGVEDGMGGQFFSKLFGH